MNLLRTGNYVLHSGRKSRLKICCEMFSDDDINTLAWLICKLVGPFKSVEGIPEGGVRFEQILKHCVDKRGEGPHLIVDDVFTTGRSMEDARTDYYKYYESPDDLIYIPPYVTGVVVFARGALPSWIKAVFPFPMELWDV